MNNSPEDAQKYEDKVEVSPWAFFIMSKLVVQNSVLQAERDSALERSYRDGLTDAMNFRYLEEKVIPSMARHIARKRHPNSPEKSNMYFGIADIDKFKEVNDKYGHPIGDSVLKCVSESLASCVRPDDIVGRYGGDEFYIVATISNDIIVEPSELSELITKRCENTLKMKSDIVPDISMAFVKVDDYKTPEIAIGEADALMYFTKEQKTYI